MSKDYKSRPDGGKKNVGSLWVGILIGLLLGLAIALAIAWYINKMPSPFIGRAPANKTDATSPTSVTPAPPIADTKPRFDFYKILPGSEEPITDEQFKASQQKSAATTVQEAYFLQIGAFQNAGEADNRKAQLALLGVEATVQTITAPDKGIWHRVRAGPYTNVAELDNVRDMLKQNGIETTLVRVSAVPPDNSSEGK
jgi:cell division protein FtsN